MSSPSTSRLSAQMGEVFFLFSLRSKYVASSGRTVSLEVMPARRPPVKVWISCKAEWIWRMERYEQVWMRQTLPSLGKSAGSADLFSRSGVICCYLGTNRGPTKQVRATHSKAPDNRCRRCSKAGRPASQPCAG